jgi:hypothetical protein
MKNKVKLIDINILSSYMGRRLTGLVTLLVLALTISALFYRGGFLRHSPIEVCVVGESPETGNRHKFEPLRNLLAHETRRSVAFKFFENPTPSFELYIMPVLEFLREEKKLDIVPLYAYKTMHRGPDRAVIIAAQGREIPDLSKISPYDVIFASPVSLNGFFVPLAVLESRGMHLPDALESLHFAGGYWDSSSRVVLGVVYGAYELGACRQSDIDALIEKKVLREGEVRIVAQADALPEVVIASCEAESDYFNKKLSSVENAFKDGRSGNRMKNVELARAYGLQGLEPIDSKQLQAARELFRRFGEQF